MMDDFLAQRIANKAREWVKLRVPYVHRGTTVRGCDCTGFLIGVIQSLGYLQNYKLAMYSKDWNLHQGCEEQIIKEITKYADEVTDLRIGDVLVFRFGRAKSHAGIYLGEHIFAHSYQDAKRCCYGVLKNSIWSERWSMTFRKKEKRLIQ